MINFILEVKQNSAAQMCTNVLKTHRIIAEHFDRSFVAGIKKYWSIFGFPVRVVDEILYTERIIVCKTKMIDLWTKKYVSSIIIIFQFSIIEKFQIEYL